MLELEDLTSEIIAAAIEVHRDFGPGLLESAYEACLCRELSTRGLSFRPQVSLPVQYKGVQLDCGYRLDLVVEDLVVLELKCVSELTDLHKAQLLTYLKLSGKSVGLILNFNVPLMKQGIHRMVL
ncbi:MAG TPA: GxxExxY protein [Lacipirellulaceae bacterium]|nr:GxxExxY protein [Lacipirellulaceae bacterium]HMP04974.1 GxxExxY protein [Lacipirellulaceae bacterium]